jgi:hypothetical protein
VVLASLDLFIVNVALPDMASDLGASGLGELSWVLNAYAIVYASLLVLFGRLADRYPRELGFLVDVTVFTLASAACGAATSVGMLVAFRIIQAAGAALLTPTSLGLVPATTAPAKRHGAVRAWTAVGGLAAALGPVVGGLLVAASWRWVFFVNVPIGLAAVVVGYMRVKGGDWGWGSAATVGVLLAAVALIAAFAFHCLHVRNPLIEPQLFRIRPFTGASAVGLIFSIAFGAGAVIAAGSLIFCGGTAWWAASAQTIPEYASVMLPGILLTGVGVGLTMPTFMATAASALPPQSFATGSGVVNMMRQVGLAIGVAVFVAVLGSPVGSEAAVSAFRDGWIVIAATAAASAVAGALTLPTMVRSGVVSSKEEATPALKAD